jgi:SAM-dependent methyltransferase
LRPRRDGSASVADEAHPERLAVLPYIRGRCVEVGCGHRKTAPEVIGIDLVPGGHPGRAGNTLGLSSQADVAADGSKLPVQEGSVDSLVARHNLEHYVDTVAVLTEWRRVLAPGGSLALIVPDEERYIGRTVDLDETHYHAFTEESLTTLIDLIGGFVVVRVEPVIPGWSFMVVAQKIAT